MFEVKKNELQSDWYDKEVEIGRIEKSEKKDIVITAVIKHYYKNGGLEALVDDKPRGGFRNGAGRPRKSVAKWHAKRGEVKEGNRWVKVQ